MADEVSSAPAPQPEPTGAKTPGATGPEIGDAADNSPKKPKTWLWVAIALVVLILLGGAYYLSQSDDGETATVAVPDVVGLTQETAGTTITSAGLAVGEVSEEPTLGAEPGTVVAQDPSAGTAVEQNAAVDLVVATVPMAKVPDVVGDSQEEATAKLSQEGLRLEDAKYDYSTKVDAGFVISQDPAAGEEVVVGSAVTLTISKGEETGKVPDVVGLSQDDATDALEAAGFEVKTTKETSEDVDSGDVISQSPEAGDSVSAGSTVTITVSTGAPDAPQSVVPDVVGVGALQAMADLLAADLKVEIGWVGDDDNVFKITAQTPAGGTEVDPGTTVAIDIGLPQWLIDFEMPSELPTATPEPLPAPAEPESSETTGS